MLDETMCVQPASSPTETRSIHHVWKTAGNMLESWATNPYFSTHSMWNTMIHLNFGMPENKLGAALRWRVEKRKKLSAAPCNPWAFLPLFEVSSLMPVYLLSTHVHFSFTALTVKNTQFLSSSRCFGMLRGVRRKKSRIKEINFMDYNKLYL